MHDLTLASARKALRERRLSAVELTDHFLASIKKLDDEINSFVTVTEDQARAGARAADALLATDNAPSLCGLPLGIKDLFCTNGVRTTASSNILRNFVPPYESTVTSNLLADGAIFLGKMNLDEFAMGSTNMTSAFGPVTNPWRRKALT